MNPNTVEAKQEQLIKLNSDTQAVIEKAKAESRDLTDIERQSVDVLLKKFDATKAEIDLLQRAEASAAALSQVQPRKTVDSTSESRAVAYPVDDKGTWGFKHMGEFLMSVRNIKDGVMDPRFIKAAQTTYGSEVVLADGGAAVPPDFRPEIMKALGAPESLFAKLDQLITTSNAVSLPVDEDPPWSATGITVASVVEGNSYTGSKPALHALTITVGKRGGIVYITNEMLEDVPSIGSYVAGKAGDKLAYSLNSMVMTALNGSGAKVTVPKTTGAAAGSPADLANIQEMFWHMPQAWQGRAIWLANPRYQMLLQNVTYPAGTTNWPVFLPAGGISQASYATIYGRPVVFSENCAAVGTIGDIMLVDPLGFYGVSKSNGVKADVSIHFAFDQDLTAFKVSVRSAAASKYSAVLPRPDSTAVGNCVVLATRS